MAAHTKSYKTVIVFSITDLMWLSILHLLLKKKEKKSLNLSIVHSQGITVSVLTIESFCDLPV